MAWMLRRRKKDGKPLLKPNIAFNVRARGKCYLQWAVSRGYCALHRPPDHSLRKLPAVNCVFVSQNSIYKHNEFLCDRWGWKDAGWVEDKDDVDKDGNIYVGNGWIQHTNRSLRKLFDRLGATTSEEILTEDKMTYLFDMMREVNSTDHDADLVKTAVAEMQAKWKETHSDKTSKKQVSYPKFVQFLAEVRSEALLQHQRSVEKAISDNRQAAKSQRTPGENASSSSSDATGNAAAVDFEDRWTMLVDIFSELGVHGLEKDHKKLEGGKIGTTAHDVEIVCDNDEAIRDFGERILSVFKDVVQGVVNSRGWFLFPAGRRPRHQVRDVLCQHSR